jgi:HEAT repeat protein
MEELINQLPARDSLEAKLIFNAIISYGQDGITLLGQSLDSPDRKSQIQAELALHGLAIYVSDPGKENQRLLYVSGLAKALQKDLPIEKKTFLISQLRFAGRDESVSVLASFIYNPDLCESSTQALTAIGTESAGNALLEALYKIDGDGKVAVIQGLGSMQFEPAALPLLDLLNNSEDNIKDAAVFAVSNIGIKNAQEPLRLFSKEEKKYQSGYLRLAERLGEKGDIETCRAICMDILDNDYPENLMIGALEVMVTYDPDNAIDILYEFISGTDKKLRRSALNLIVRYKQSEYVQSLIRISRNGNSEIQSDILNLFGEQKCISALSYIQKSLQSSSPDIRMISVLSLYNLQDQVSLSDMEYVLMDSLKEEQRVQIEKILVSSMDTEVIDDLLKSFGAYPPTSKIIVLNVISEFIIKNKSENDSPDPEIQFANFRDYYISSLQSDSHDLRMTSLKGLERIGESVIVEQLIEFILNTEDIREQRLGIKAISSIVNRSKSQKDIHVLINNNYTDASVEHKTLLLDLFKSVGSKELMEPTIRTLEQQDENLQLAAIRALSEWSNNDVLNVLLETSHSHKNVKVRILAQRGALRIINEGQMGDQRAILYYKTLLNSDLRPEEKRQVLAGLSQIQTKSSLELTTTLLNDPDVHQEALTAILSISQIEIDTPEAPEGFRTLFNGKDLDGWQGLVGNPVTRKQMSEEELQSAQVRADSLMKSHWHVIDGILYFDGGGSHLCTIDEFSDFELYVDWKIEKDGDSGIYLRGSPQIQIWDATIWPEGSGGLYNNQNNSNVPIEKADNPVGEWNTFHIIIQGGKVTVYLNDILVVDNVEMENYWERDKPIYTSGPIELQSHFTPLYFRNIYIRELESEKPLFEGSLFNGKDLQGWQVIGNEADSWQGSEGILYTEAKGMSWISSEEQYKDFELELEYRIPSEGNSGIFIRAPREGEPWISGLEIQLLDDQADIHSELQSWQFTGSIYGVKGPQKPMSKKHGVWQKMNILCVGPRIKVTLNDKLINDINLIDHMDMEEKIPGIKRRTGYIGLQNHETKIEFRNIKIREIAK